MKKICSTIMILVIMVTTLSLFACGSSDDGDNGDIITTPISITQKLVKVTRSDNTEYFYDNKGRITQVTIRYNYPPESDAQVTRSYSYDNNTIIETNYLRGLGPDYQNIYTIENGRITKMYDGDGKKNYNFSYKDGYIIRQEKESAYGNDDMQYEWRDGNLITIWRNEKASYTYEYTNYTAPQGFFPMRGKANICGCWGMSGYLGKSMKNLPSKFTEAGFSSYYEWTIEDGLPIHLQVITESNGKPYSTDSYMFEWE